MKGLVQLESGEQYHLRSANMWASEWIVTDSHGQPVLRFHNKGFLKHGAQLDVEESARSIPHLPFLILFIWYILLLHQMDSSSAVVAGS